MLTKADDYPIHQLPEPIATAGTDRNFYDRYFFNGYSPDGSTFFACALGVYPHLNIMDAAFSMIHEGVQRNLHASKIMHMERMDTTVGPIGIEVIEPLKRLRVRVSNNEYGIEADITFTARARPVEEPRFTYRIGPSTFMDYTRLTQNGSYEGFVSVKGKRIAVDSKWLGTRDRSWGVRPVGEKEPDGIRQNANVMGARMWNYFPMRFEDHSIFYILQEGTAGETQLVQAERVWLDGRIEQLGHPSHEHTMEGREISHSTISFESGLKIECFPLLPNYIAIGTGYGLEPDCRVAASQPAAVEMALRLLDTAGAWDERLVR